MSRHPDQEIINLMKKDKNRAQAAVREKQSSPKISQGNSTCEYETVKEEFAARNAIVTDQIKIIKSRLPDLLKQLSKIKDPRNPKKIKHKLSILMIYGIFMFVFNVASRREADREMTRPVFLENLKKFFPEIERVRLF